MTISEKDVQDFATEMGIEAAVEGPIKALMGAARRFANRNNDALREAWEREARDRQARVIHRMGQRLNDLEEESDNRAEFLAKVEIMVNDHQFWRLQANLGYEALRESLDSRKEMLEAAAVGLADPNMSIEDKARVERALRDIDAADLAAVRELWRVVEECAVDSPPGMLNASLSDYIELCRRTREVLARAPVSRGALLGTVVVEDNNYEGGPHYDVSALGELVLQVLRGYPDGGRHG